jgi:hypothetical protein
VRLDSSVIICRSATVRDGNTVDLEGIGIDTYFFQTFPATTEIPLFIRAVGAHDTREHHLLVQVSDANGDVRSETIAPVVFGPRPAELPEGWEVRAVSAFSFGVAFNSPGAYLLTVSVDGSDVHSQPIFVRLA